MTATYKVAIDGKPIPFHAHTWNIERGLAAPLQAWIVPNEIAAELLGSKLGQECELTLESLTIKRAILIGNAPADDPFYQLLVFTDVRWYWTRKWLVLDANVRRRVGDTRLLGNELQQSVVAPTVAYARWSLNKEVPFTWETFAKKALEFASKVDDVTISWTIDQGGFSIEAKTIEETTTDSGLPTGLGRAIFSIPGRNVYVDHQGTVHVYNAMPGTEKGYVDGLRGGGHLQDHGDLTWLDLRASRPKKEWRIYSTPELEVRFTYDSNATVNADDPYLEPVIAVPELTLQIPATGGNTARTVGQNSWVTNAEFFAACGAGPSTGQSSTPPLSDEVIREGYLGGWLYPNYVNAWTLDPDVGWARKIDAVMRCWRRTYRINPRFWQRVLTAQCKTSAVWDTVNGIRAPSPVFVNLARKPSVRWLAANITRISVNDTSSYPGNGLLSSGIPARADVHFLDLEQGIIEITPKADYTGRTVDTAPSAIDENGDIDPGKDPVVTARLWPFLKLVGEGSHKVATVLSCVPAAPNDVRRLYSVTVTLAEAAQSLGIDTNLQGAGPTQELRTHLATARFAWQDSQDTRDRILAFFGASPEQSVSATDPSLVAKSLAPINLESEIRPLSVSVAAADLWSKLDHYEGSFTVPMDAGLRPIGSVTRITHMVQSGAARSKLTATPVAESAPRAEDLLPKSVRAALLHLVAEHRS